MLDLARLIGQNLCCSSLLFDLSLISFDNLIRFGMVLVERAGYGE